MSILKKIFGDPTAKEIEEIRQKVVTKVNDLESEYSALTDEQLRGKTEEFKKILAAGKTLDDILVPAFATVREASKRTLGMRHFDVQLIGGVVLHRGKITEMRTGEGKTLVATLAAYLNALEGKGVHVVTVNDYLSKRDACWMGQVYSFLGLSIGILQNQLLSYVYDPENTSIDYLDRVRKCSRPEAYNADITYGTNNEFGFDYLRDNMVVKKEEMSQRELHYAVVDEIDSILIDEARTPLIISAPAEESTEQYYRFAQLVTQLKENEDYNIDEKMRAATLTDPGINKIEKSLGLGNIYTEGGISMVHHLEQALKALVLFKRDRDYVVKDNEVLIVDEFTGRMMPGRRYSEGLHQALEAKEGVEIQRESQTLATVTFQNLFRMYHKLSGMTGTAATEAEEFSKIYRLDVTTIPTNKPMIRFDFNDLIYKNEKGKFTAVVQKVKELYDKGQPVLIGTISIEKNEILSELLSREGVPHEALNAKNHEREAQIVAQAGRSRAVTLATNMAGRGVDIILGGAMPAKDAAEYGVWQQEHQKVVELGGLFVLGTERHESRRIDNQLRGRSGRQGDPGNSQFFISLEDDLMRVFGPEKIKGMMELLRFPEDMPIENKFINKSIEAAQKKVEGNNFDIRKHLVEYDDVMNKQRETIYRRRREALDPASDLKNNVLELIKAEITKTVDFHTTGQESASWNLEEIYEVVNSIFPVDSSSRLKVQDLAEKKGKKNFYEEEARDEVVGYLFELAVKRYNEIELAIGVASGKADMMRDIEKGMILRSIDSLWVEHLDAIDHLRRGIGLRGYAQHDPLVEYKREAFDLFRDLLGVINQQIVYSIFKVNTGLDSNHSLLDRRGISLFGASENIEQFADKKEIAKSSHGSVGQMGKLKDEQGNKIGRNDPCPCGAVKPDGTPIKYKDCHGR